jgi:hypothetical protein
MADYSKFIDYTVADGYDYDFVVQCLNDYLDRRHKHISLHDFRYYLLLRTQNDKPENTD